jgi:hypothetical protein
MLPFSFEKPTFESHAAFVTSGSESDFAALSINGGFELHVGFCPLRHSIPKWPDLI